MEKQKFENNMENNYICEKHKRKIEEQKPECKYCELDKLPDTSNRKYQLDKETILKIDGRKYSLAWEQNGSSGGKWYCKELNFYFVKLVSGN